MRRLLIIANLLLTSCASLARHSDTPIVSRSAIQIGTVTHGDMPLHVSADGFVVSDLSPIVAVLIFVGDGQGSMLRAGQPAEMRAHGRSARGALAEVLGGSTVDSTLAIVHFGRGAPETNPDASVEITIDVGIRPNTLYVLRPLEARASGEGSLWRLQRDERSASRVTVRYGLVAGPFVEIAEGLKAGDRVILSDLSQWSGRSHLRVNP